MAGGLTERQEKNSRQSTLTSLKPYLAFAYTSELNLGDGSGVECGDW